MLVGLLSQQAMVPSSVRYPSQHLPEGLHVHKNMNIGSNRYAGAASGRPAEARTVDDPWAPKLVLKAWWSQGSQPVSLPGFLPSDFFAFPLWMNQRQRGAHGLSATEVSIIKGQKNTEFWRNEPQVTQGFAVLVLPSMSLPQKGTFTAT